MVVAHDSPDAPAGDRQLEVAGFDIGDEVVGQEGGVLEHAAVEVDDVKGAVGSVGHHHRAEPFVGRRQELFFFVGVSPGEQAILLGDQHPLDEVGGGLGDEGVAPVFGRERIAAVDHGPAGRGGGGERAVGAQGLGVVAAIHARGRVGRVDRLVLHHLAIDPDCIAEERVAGVGGGREQVSAEQVRVVVIE